MSDASWDNLTGKRRVEKVTRKQNKTRQRDEKHLISHSNPNWIKAKS